MSKFNRNSRPKSKDDLKKSSSNKRNSRNFSKSKGKMSENKEQLYSEGPNPLEWYTRYPYLLQSTASIPFPNRPGMSVDVIAQSNGNVLSDIIPGVFGIEFCPSVGFSEDNTSPVSQVAKEMYGRVRKSFSSDLAVDAPDFIMYMMGLDSIFMNLAFMKRVWRLVNSYSPDNYAMPETLLKAMGFSNAQIVSLRTNWMQGFGMINELVLMTRKFRCPAIMDIMNRHYWMCDNVYTDAPTINSQFYLFIPHNYYVYNEMEDTKGGMLQSKSYLDNMIGTWEEMYTKVKTQIDAFGASSDNYTISGYLMRAFEGTPSFVVEELTIDQRLTPLFEPVVNAQIENARCHGVTDAYLDITQNPNTNAIIFKPYVTDTTGLSSYINKPLLNIRSDNPTIADVVEATRLMTTYGPAQSVGSIKLIPLYGGSEIVCAFSITVGNSGGTTTTNFTTTGPLNNFATAETLQQALRLVAQIEKFDWHPLYIPAMCLVASDVANSDNWNACWDFYNITNLTNKAIDDIHRVCLYSEFNAFSIMD